MKRVAVNGMNDAAMANYWYAYLKPDEEIILEPGQLLGTSGVKIGFRYNLIRFR